MRREDMGTRIGRLADAVTKEQLAELLAIQWFALPINGKRIRSAISAIHRDGETRAALIANEIIRWEVKNRRQGYAIITELGMHVLHARIENDLRDAGKLPPEPTHEPE